MTFSNSGDGSDKSLIVNEIGQYFGSALSFWIFLAFMQCNGMNTGEKTDTVKLIVWVGGRI